MFCETTPKAAELGWGDGCCCVSALVVNNAVYVSASLYIFSDRAIAGGGVAEGSSAVASNAVHVYASLFVFLGERE
jgi:hypothetical protein